MKLRYPAGFNEYGRPVGVRLVDVGEGQARMGGNGGQLVVGDHGYEERHRLSKIAREKAAKS